MRTNNNAAIVELGDATLQRDVTVEELFEIIKNDVTEIYRMKDAV